MEGPASSPTVTVVVPCYCEAPNVAPMVAGLSRALDGTAWEVVFVDDDSPDDTIGRVRDIARRDARVRGLRRIGRRGLSTAVIEGILSSSAEIVAVMDGDLQHDESVLPALLGAVSSGADVAVASRHVEGGDASGLSGRYRHLLSDGGIRLAQTVMRRPLTDPMSGFFAVRRDVFEAALPYISGTGFKILLDLVMSLPAGARVVEVPSRFRPRVAGESKLDAMVMVQFAGMVLDKLSGRRVPLRFLAFALVGLVGVSVNLAAAWLARLAGLDFTRAAGIGTVVAMLANFWLNNALTYRDRKLRGARAWTGLALFLAICGLGALANIGIAHMIFERDGGVDRATALGAVIGVVWNYAVSATLIWR